MNGVLGVAEHDVVVTYRGGAMPLGQLPRSAVANLSYSRVVDDVSECKVDVAIDPRCCGLVGQMRTWGHEIHVLRDGVEVWCGPIVVADIGRDDASFIANDMLAWTKKRFIQHRLDYTGAAAADLTTIALAILNDVMTPDDPNLLAYVQSTASNIVGERLMVRGRSIAWDDLSELARTGLDFTTVGRAVIIGGESIITAPLATLTAEHFLDGLRVVERGDLGATQWRVNGSGVAALVGSTDPFYGLLEAIADEPAIRDVASATVAAQNRVDVTYPVPLYVQVPENARLSPTAPVPFSHLVPGALCQVAVDQLCRNVNQAMRLQSVSVDSSPQDTDRVAVTFAPVGATEAAAIVESGE